MKLWTTASWWNWRKKDSSIEFTSSEPRRAAALAGRQTEDLAEKVDGLGQVFLLDILGNPFKTSEQSRRIGLDIDPSRDPVHFAELQLRFLGEQEVDE